MKDIFGNEVKRIQCPCCGYYTQLVDIEDEKPYLCFEICKVCFWQYDEVMHDRPDIAGGANHVSLTEARKNYQKFGVCEPEFLNMVRPPLPEELPVNNLDV